LARNLVCDARLLNRQEEMNLSAAEILVLTAWREDARFRAAKWFTHRTSLTRFAKVAALRGWKHCAAERVERSNSPPIGNLRQLVRDCSLKPEKASRTLPVFISITSGERSMWGQWIISGLVPFYKDEEADLPSSN
jgi:hypothetical protein